MIINIHETISNIMDENREMISSKKSETYILYPSEGKLLRNKKTGITTDSYVGVGSKSKVDDFEEIDKE